MQEAIYIVSNMFIPTPWVFSDGALLKQGLSAPELGVAILSAAAIFVVEWISLRTDLLAGLRRQHLLYRWAFYYALIMAIVIFGAYGGTYNAADFLYFQVLMTGQEFGLDASKDFKDELHVSFSGAVSNHAVAYQVPGEDLWAAGSQAR